ncbi:hypothetical protein [Chthonobacter albigriseus]|uniref:hypothetical protein n=1 Tax=Chthonobacter albigriseus TaxID=1683161 RepID=UPI0015EF1383|nr:hypothetical protein [Chthonobacter albigriseus]
MVQKASLSTSGTLDRIVRAFRFRRVGPTVVVAASTLVLPLAAALAWSAHGFWSGTWTTILMVVAFNIGLVLGFVVRLRQKERRRERSGAPGEDG